MKYEFITSSDDRIEDLKIYIFSHDMYCVLSELDETLRREIKHGDHPEKYETLLREYRSKITSVLDKLDY